MNKIFTTLSKQLSTILSNRFLINSPYNAKKKNNINNFPNDSKRIYSSKRTLYITHFLISRERSKEIEIVCLKSLQNNSVLNIIV